MTEFSPSNTTLTAGIDVLYPSLTQAEIAKIMQFIDEQERERRLTVGRQRYMMSYWIRRGNDRNDHPFSKATAETARRHISLLIQEIRRLRDVLRDISFATTDRTAQAMALEAVAEPDLGPPDIVCSPSPEDASTDAAARALFTDDQLLAWEKMGRKTCKTCGVPLRPCPKGPGADEPGYVGFYPCRHDGEDPNG